MWISFIFAVLNSRRESCRSGLTQPMQSSSGTLSSLEASLSGCGSPSSPVRVEGDAGQRINISMLEFGNSGHGRGGAGHSCQPYGYILERRLGMNKTLCGRAGARERTVYVSTTNSVEIVMTTRPSGTTDAPNFLLHYEGKAEKRTV